MGKGKPSKAEKRAARRPGASVVSGKRSGDPKAMLPGAGSSGERVCWRFEHVDHDGPWGFDKVQPDMLCEILRKLRDFESMTVEGLRRQVEHFKSYNLAEPGLCKAARERLAARGWDDLDSIQRLRFSGPQRLYGFLLGNVFHIVWWDPLHEVYPSKRH